MSWGDFYLAQYEKICVVDNTPFMANRRDAKYCSDQCRQKISRGGKPPKGEFIVTSQVLGEPTVESFLPEDAPDPQPVKRSELISTSSDPETAELERDLHAAALKENGIAVEPKAHSYTPTEDLGNGLTLHTIGIDPAKPGDDRTIDVPVHLPGFRGGKAPLAVRKARQTGVSPKTIMKVAKQQAAEKNSAEPEAPLKNVRAGLRERMNARLRAKGLPLIMDKPEVYHFVATGIPQLDSLTANMDVAGIGGLPRKHITEIYGPKGSGKSSLVKAIYKENPDLRILFFDAEGGLTAPPEGIDIVKGNVAENIMTTLIEMVQAQEYDLIILDSVASLVTKKQFEDDPEGKAAMARVFGPLVKRLVAHMQPLGEDGYPSDIPGTAIVFINQFRSTTQSFGLREYTVGGKALEYYASLRLEMRSAKSDYIIRNGKLAGQQVRVKVEKTRFGEKDQEVKYPIMFEQLQVSDEDYIRRLKEMGLR
jgi:recombination protein RecA